MEKIENRPGGPGAARLPLSALIAAARNNRSLKSRIIRMYDHFLSVCREELQRAVPSATGKSIDEIAYGILSLAIGNDILLSTGTDSMNRELARNCAGELVRNLRGQIR